MNNAWASESGGRTKKPHSERAAPAERSIRGPLGARFFFILFAFFTDCGIIISVSEIQGDDARGCSDVEGPLKALMDRVLEETASGGNSCGAVRFNSNEPQPVFLF